MGKPRHPRLLRRNSSPKRSHRSLGPTRLGFHILESDSPGRQRINIRRRLPLISVGAQSVCPKRVDQYKENIQVLAVAQGRKIFRSTLGYLAAHSLELGQNGHEEQDARQGEIKPG